MKVKAFLETDSKHDQVNTCHVVGKLKIGIHILIKTCLADDGYSEGRKRNLNDRRVLQHKKVAAMVAN